MAPDMHASWIELVDGFALQITIVTGSLMGLVAVGNLLSRPLTKNRFMAAATFFSMAVLILSVGLGHRRFHGYFLLLYGIHLPIYFVVAYLFMAYLRGVAKGPSTRPLLRFPGYFWLAAFFIASAIFLPTVFMPLEYKLAFLENRITEPYVLVYRRVWKGLGFAGVLILAYTSVRLFFELRIIDLIKSDGNASPDDKPVLWHFRVMVFWTALMMVLAFVSQYFSSGFLKRLAMALVCLSVLWLYLLEYRYPGFFGRIHREIQARKSRYRKTRLGKLDADATMELLNRVMREEQFYADEELTLERLAARVELQSAQLSELLNNVMGVDFHKYVTRFRVDAARRMLLREPERTILDIAYASGFNSKSSFHRNFKAVVGRTPTDFRKDKADQNG